MMFAMLDDVVIGLWWVAVTSTVAAVVSFRAVWLGVIPRSVGMIGALALGCIATSYWLDIANAADPIAENMRRGAALILWPAMAFSVCWLLRQAKQTYRAAAGA